MTAWAHQECQDRYCLALHQNHMRARTGSKAYYDSLGPGTQAIGVHENCNNSGHAARSTAHVMTKKHTSVNLRLERDVRIGGQ